MRWLLPLALAGTFSWRAVLRDPHVAQALVAELASAGFVHVADHGVPEGLLAHALHAGKRFFASPLQEKERFLTPPGRNLKCGRGYIPVLGEQLDAAGSPDPKEVLDLGLPATPVHEQHLGPTPWPAEVENATRALAAPLKALSLSALRVLAAAFEIELAAFDTPMMLTRYTHYLPSAGLGCGSHSDFGGLTWVFQESPGLEVRRSVGDEELDPVTFAADLEHSYGPWVGAAPLPGTLVLQVGEAMQRVTAGHLAASRHRVVGTAADRYTISVFVDPDPDATLAPAPTLRPTGRTYAPLLAGHKGILLLQAASKVV